MRIAVISDIHGNLQALEAVLEDVQTERPDMLVVAGDIVNGAPDSAACWRVLTNMDAILLRGNHERYLFDLGTPREAPEWRTERFGPTRWTAARFDPAELVAMAELPLSWREPETGTLLVVHAAPASDTANLRSHTPEHLVAKHFGDITEPFVARAHDHIGNVRHWGGRTFVSAGSVGLPLDGVRDAQYLLLEHHEGGWHYHHKAVRYDVQGALRRFRETGYLEEAGPMARLIMREVATASHYMTPCISFWQECMPDASFAQAVDKFLAAY